MASGYRYRILDVFTDRPCTGNPLAVIPEAGGLDARRMQLIAREFNLSETAFVFPPASDAETHRLRIFTPARELPFAGHPTIGTALALAAEGYGEPELVLGEGVGPVRVSLRDGADGVSAWLHAARLPETGPQPPPPEALAALAGLSVTDLLGGEWGPAAVSAGVPFLVIPVRDAEALSRARLDLARWREILAGWWATQVYLVARMNGVERLRARMFAPDMGITEDPATGAAAAALPAWLVPRLGLRNGRLAFEIEQGVEMGRPSELRVEVDVAAGRIDAVRVGGSAVMMGEGRIRAPD